MFLSLKRFFCNILKCNKQTKNNSNFSDRDVGLKYQSVYRNFTFQVGTGIFIGKSENSITSLKNECVELAGVR